MDIQVELRGLRETRDKMEQTARDLHGQPMLDGMRIATLLVTRNAKTNSPVDQGKLKSSIAPDVRAEGREVQGVVGSNLKYAPYVELGTRPHFPPLAALETWARRHGTTAYAVALAIAKRGTKAHKYLERALESNRNKIQDLLGDVVARIVKK